MDLAKFPKLHASLANAFPVPTSVAQGTFVYDYPDDHRGGAVQLEVRKRADGSYYGWTDKYDFEEPNSAALVARLTKLRARHVGYGSDED